jgi:putative protein-disulfide isomerase
MAATLHYIFDPLCGWCYAASPLVRATMHELSEVVALRLHPGLLFEDPVNLGASWRHHIVQADQHIHQLSGVRFGGAYFERIKHAEPLIFASSPPAAAVLAAEQLGASAGLDMLEAIQLAHYEAGLDVCDPQQLRSIAAQLSLPIEDFDLALNQQLKTLPVKTQSARSMLQASGGKGFPTFVLETDVRRVRIDHSQAYGQPITFIDQINHFLSGEHA